MSAALDLFPPTRAAAIARIAQVDPAQYARSRNAVDGAVSRLSPYITHGIVTLPEVLAGVCAKYRLNPGHKWVFELGWREYFRHVWHHRGDGILSSLHEGLLPEKDYGANLPADILEARTGVPVIDEAVRTLYASGYLHNHARMWLASYVVHVRKVHWRVGADWLYRHLLDGDLASNHLSWQWVAATGSRKPYLFNADNVARYAPPAWHSPGSVIDTSYDDLDRLARVVFTSTNGAQRRYAATSTGFASEPPAFTAPVDPTATTAPNAGAVRGKDVWLVHPWSLGDLPNHLADHTVVVGIFVSDFHQAWPWTAGRWHFVSHRMAELTTQRWYACGADIATALKSARSVRTVADPHLANWLPQWAQCLPAPTLFPALEQRCDSFSQWWTRVSPHLRPGVLAQTQPHEGTAAGLTNPL